jgi:hypothetical protein
MRKAFFWVTVLSGAAAAYLMYKHGKSLSDIASTVVKDPFGSFFNEIKQS